MPEPADRIPLEDFLAPLPDATANEARHAAQRMEMLERQVGPPGWLERNLISLGMISLALFVIGTGALVGAFSWLRSVIGIGGITVLAAAFPVLMFVYLFSVRARTAVDREKMDLNERHFLPHGGVYFTDAESPDAGMVLRIDPPTEEELTLRDKFEAQYRAASRRRW